MAAKSDAEHYDSERAREEVEVNEKAEVEASEVAEVFQSYGLTTEESTLIVDALRKRRGIHDWAGNFLKRPRCSNLNRNCSDANV